MKRTKILDVVVFFSLILIIVSIMPLIAEHEKSTICKSCEAQNWTGELPAVDMKINCSEVKSWCEEMESEKTNHILCSTNLLYHITYYNKTRVLTLL